MDFTNYHDEKYANGIVAERLIKITLNNAINKTSESTSFAIISTPTPNLVINKDKKYDSFYDSLIKTDQVKSIILVYETSLYSKTQTKEIKVTEPHFL